MKLALWDYFIDVGGTFTDCIEISPDGKLNTHKLLSDGTYIFSIKELSAKKKIITNLEVSKKFNFFSSLVLRIKKNSSGIFYPVKLLKKENNRVTLDYKDLDLENGDSLIFSSKLPSCILAIHWLQNSSIDSLITNSNIKLGTTIGTNLILERKGSNTALIVTKGFKDLLSIGDQTRTDLFDLSPTTYFPLTNNIFEIEERIDSSGNITENINEEKVKSIINICRKNRIESISISLLNAYTNPIHEKFIAKVFRNHGYSNITYSSDISDKPGYLYRTHTTVIDSYLNGPLNNYFTKIKNKLDSCTLKIMKSNGALAPPENYLAKDSLFSGPSGGAIACLNISIQNPKYENLIAFDMGGTSTDICKIKNGQLNYSTQKSIVDSSTHTRSDIFINTVDMETIANGGGSICGFDGIELFVGPHSASANPGPACYDRGGPLTLTDLNFYLGRISKENFPIPLNKKAVEIELKSLANLIEKKRSYKYALKELSIKLLDIGNEQMSSPIRDITEGIGESLKEYGLVIFGGAAAQHGCDIADKLKIDTVILPPLGSIFSAQGIGEAEETELKEVLFIKELDSSFDQKVKAKIDHFCKSKKNSLILNIKINLSYNNQQNSLTIDLNDYKRLVSDFISQFKTKFGFIRDDIITSNYLLVEWITKKNTSKKHLSEFLSKLVSQNYFWKTPDEDSRNRRQTLKGYNTELYLPPHWKVSVDENGYLILKNNSKTQISRFFLDPGSITLYSKALLNIANAMGKQLEHTSYSVNIKERKDFSCGIFSKSGDLIVNAPHIPVHLGAMSETINHLLKSKAKLIPGDCYICNHPANGGSHLPDITVITPFFDGDANLLYFCANRAHHAEIGGITPGSMPPNATSLEEEGVIIPLTNITKNGQFLEKKLKSILLEGKYPTRNCFQNLEDLKAQMAANQKGSELITNYFDKNLNHLDSIFSKILENGKIRCEEFIRSLLKDTYQFEDYLDDSTKVKLKITKNNNSLIFDFAGSSPVHKGNFNTNISIVKSCILYCIRSQIKSNIGINSGLLFPISLKIPKNSFLAPEVEGLQISYPAVCAGNVETSQRIVDVILSAFNICGQAQGTMNNFLFGNNAGDFSLYETIGGGYGALSYKDGSSGIQAHMTNTKITDPEILEKNYPIQLISFQLRKYSGGTGKYNGGDGLLRHYKFLSPGTVSIISQRRTMAPKGAKGANNGSPGINHYYNNTKKSWILLDSLTTVKVRPNDQIKIETPGGGGFYKQLDS